MATYVLNTVSSDLTCDELRMLHSACENHYWGSPVSARDLHELTVLWYQAQGFARAKGLPQPILLTSENIPAPTFDNDEVKDYDNTF